MITPTNNSNLQFHNPEADQAGLYSMSMSTPAPPQNPLAMLDDILRGRWKIAIVLGIVLAILFAVAGYKLAPIRFSSTGRIHVAPKGSAILYETEDTGNLLGYAGVVGTQAKLVKSAGVIDYALMDPTLSSLALVKNPNAREIIANNLEAGPERGTELITVTYEAATPEEAQLVLNAVLQAYDERHGQSAGDKHSERLDKLLDLRRENQSKRNLTVQETNIFISQSEYGANNLTKIIDNRLLIIDGYRETLHIINGELALRGPESDETNNPEEMVISEPTVEELELIDPDLATLRRQYSDEEIDLQQLRERYYGNMKHHSIVSKIRYIELLQEQIASRIEAANERWYASGGMLLIDGASSERLSHAQLVKQKETVNKLHAKVMEEVKKLNDVQRRLEELKQNELDAKEALEEVTEKINILKLESDPSMFMGRIEIIEKGSLSMAPSKDKRIQLAVAGSVGGFGFSMALFVLIGLLDKRAYSASQLRHDESKYRCLGVLPDLTAGRLDPARAEVAVHCVHQIRNKIEAHRPPTKSFVLLVTSAMQGDGKTSLAMALASSYAFAGYRTILIDCDLVGMGVTRQNGLSKHEGLREVLGRKAGVNQVTRVMASNLDVLGAGVDSRFGPESVRRDEFAAMCNDLRHKYDIIIIDSGPFIGSVELLPVAISADSVVLTVRRGRSRTKLEECIADLNKLNVHTVGVVLNRAVSSDCDHYVSYSVISERKLITTNGELSEDESGSKREASENALLNAMNMSHEDDDESSELKQD